MKMQKYLKIPLLCLLFSLSISSSSLTQAETKPTAKPKYGPAAALLSRAHEYLRTALAPDYWALSPYYVPQQDDRSCSLASVTMVVNAARSGRTSRPALGSEDELATQKTVLKRVNSEIWNKGLGEGGHGVTLDQLGTLLKDSLKTFGMVATKLEVIHAEDTSAAMKALVHRALQANEKSSQDFIVANFDQGVFTGDAHAGHIAPIGAYDAKTKRVLILDPDRQWYEPYWVSEETFIQGMATQDNDAGRKRGLVWISLE